MLVIVGLIKTLNNNIISMSIFCRCLLFVAVVVVNVKSHPDVLSPLSTTKKKYNVV